MTLQVCIFDPLHEVIISAVEAVEEDPILRLGVHLLVQGVHLIRCWWDGLSVADLVNIPLDDRWESEVTLYAF